MKKRKVMSNYTRSIYPLDVTQPMAKRRKMRNRLARLIAKKNVKSKFMMLHNNAGYCVILMYPLDVMRPLAKKRKLKSNYGNM